MTFGWSSVVHDAHVLTYYLQSRLQETFGAQTILSLRPHPSVISDMPSQGWHYQAVIGYDRLTVLLGFG